jgi:hypothetical protein
MADTIVQIRLVGGKNLRKALAKLDPATNARIMITSFRQVAVLIAANARNVQILSGGGEPHRSRLTHRSRDLRDSIGPDFSGLPLYAEVGTKLFYGAIHEYGGTFARKGGTTVTFPERPFMGPALDAIEPKIPEVVVRNWKREGGL